MPIQKFLHIEILRLGAIFLVVITHYIAAFCPEMFSFWHTHWWMNGFTGKLGVAMFFVLAGYFASKPSSRSLSEYSVRRYLQFVLNIMVVLVLFVVALALGRHYSFITTCHNILRAMYSAIILDTTICNTFWCMREFLLGSILCYILGNTSSYISTHTHTGAAMVVFFDIIFCFLLWKLWSVWIAICALGWCVRKLDEANLSRPFKLPMIGLFLIMIPLLYRHPESDLTYMAQGVACAMLLYVLNQACLSYRKFRKNYTSFEVSCLVCLTSLLDGFAFALFLVHSLVFDFIHSLGYDKTFANVYVIMSIVFVVACVMTMVDKMLLRKIMEKINHTFFTKMCYEKNM